MATCYTCKEDTDGDLIKCKGCKSTFHYQFECSGVRESNFRKKTLEQKSNWRCDKCKDPADAPQSDANMLKAIFEKISKIDEISKDIKDLKTSFENLSIKYQEVVSEVAILKEENSKTSHQLGLIRNENAYLNHQLNSVKLQLNQLEQYGRRHNIEIHGVDLKKDENLPEVVERIGQMLKLPIEKGSIEAVHRLKPNKSNRPIPIIVRFSNRKYSDAWLKRKSTGLQNSNLFQNGSLTKIYINENLTATNKELYWGARMAGKKFDYKFVWTKRGSVFMRKDESAAAVKINSPEDLPKEGISNPTS